MLCHPCILRGPQHQGRGAKSEVAASPLLCRGPKRGRKCYITPAFLGVPNAKRGEQHEKWLPQPYFVGRPKEGGNGMSPLHCPRSATPSAGSKIRSGCLTPAFPGAHKRAEMLRHPCILGASQRKSREARSEVATSPLLSRRPKRGLKCYVTPSFLGLPNATPREQNQNWLPRPYFLGSPKEGGNATSALHCPGSPTPSPGSKIRNGCLTPTFSGAQERAEMLHQPSFSGIPDAKCGEQHDKWLPHPYFLGVRKGGGNATSPLHSRGP